MRRRESSLLDGAAEHKKAGRRVSGAEALGTSNAKGNIENNPIEKTKVNIPLTNLKSTIENTHN